MTDRVPAPSILIVQDDWRLGMMIARAVGRRGCRATGPAAGVVHAIALLYGEQPAAALLCTRLGRESSDLIADALAECRIPFAFVAADATEALPSRFSGRPMLRAPFEAAALETLLEGLVPPAPRRRRRTAGSAGFTLPSRKAA